MKLLAVILMFAICIVTVLMIFQDKGKINIEFLGKLCYYINKSKLNSFIYIIIVIFAIATIFSMYRFL